MDFLELKQKKERGVTNAEFMDGSKDFFEKADSIVVVGINPDGVISTFYTQSTSTNRDDGNSQPTINIGTASLAIARLFILPSTAQGVINCSCFGADRKTRFDWSRNDWRKNI